MVLIYTIICSENCMNRGLGSLIERKNKADVPKLFKPHWIGCQKFYMLKINVILVLQTKALASFDNISLLQLIISFVLLSTIIDFFLLGIRQRLEGLTQCQFRIIITGLIFLLVYVAHIEPIVPLALPTVRRTQSGG